MFIDSRGLIVLNKFVFEKIFFSTGISDTVPHRFLHQTGSNAAMITRHHCHHFPTLSLEHLSLSLRSSIALHSMFKKLFKNVRNVPK
jgi:hypothetical protein